MLHVDPDEPNTYGYVSHSATPTTADSGVLDISDDGDDIIVTGVTLKKGEQVGGRRKQCQYYRRG